MSKTKTAPAFPNSLPEQFGGLTKREWFAGQALAAMTAVPDYSGGPADSSMVERAVRIADALIDELAKEKP